MFRPKNGEVQRKSIRLQNEEVYALNTSADIIQVIKPRRMRWERKVARTGERRGAYRVLVGKSEE